MSADFPCVVLIGWINDVSGFAEQPVSSGLSAHISINARKYPMVPGLMKWMSTERICWCEKVWFFQASWELLKNYASVQWLGCFQSINKSMGGYFFSTIEEEGGGIQSKESITSCDDWKQGSLWTTYKYLRMWQIVACRFFCVKAANNQPEKNPKGSWKKWQDIIKQSDTLWDFIRAIEVRKKAEPKLRLAPCIVAVENGFRRILLRGWSR